MLYIYLLFCTFFNVRTPSEELPRYSSHNFNQDEIGSPILDIVLRPGDLLYFPRGFIHQAEALSDQHSLHITVSTYQKTTWFDLLEQVKYVIQSIRYYFKFSGP